jgi:hypothetical protein
MDCLQNNHQFIHSFILFQTSCIDLHLQLSEHCFSLSFYPWLSLFKIWFDVVSTMFNEVINTCSSLLIEHWFTFEETMDLTQ